MTPSTLRASYASVVLAACLSACGGADAPSAAGSDAASGETTESAGGEATVVGEVAPSHGGALWGVYVVVAAPGAPELEAAAAPLRERGILVSVGELSCDAGATEALGADAEAHGVSVMFATREAAERFAQTLSTPPAGIAQVTVGCAD